VELGLAIDGMGMELALTLLRMDAYLGQRGICVPENILCGLCACVCFTALRDWRIGANPQELR
jgi:hypothetical protein